MIYAELKQRTPEWYARRSGKITASKCVDMMNETVAFDKLIKRVKAERKFKKSQDEIDQLVYTHVTGFESQHQPINLAYGNMMEFNAANELESVLNVPLMEVGFVTSDEYPDLFGASPDRIALDMSFGVEIKCPVTLANHEAASSLMVALDLKKYNKEYYYQCLFNMICANIGTWIFASYMPFVDDKLHYCHIHAQEVEFDLNEIKARMKHINNLIN
jgi:hypothetical protein